MRAVVKLNGVELKDCLCIIDNSVNEVTVQTETNNGEKLNMDNVYVEVNIFGEIDL